MALRLTLILASTLVASGLRRHKSNSGCGVRGNSLGAQIINGQDANRCDWIWQAQLRTVWDDNVTCGGTLIGDTWVLTAAHCTVGKPTEGFEVVLGNYQRVGLSSGAVSRKVKRIVLNPAFNRRYLSNNLALVELMSPVSLEGCVGAVCLPDVDAALADGDECWITGWGITRIGDYDSRTENLQQAKLSTVSNDECKKEGAYPSWAITPDMVCATGQTSDGEYIDACHGDYGGPFVCQRSGQWYLHGVSSFSYGCARGTHPGVWARTAEHRDWIQEVTGI